MITMKTLKTYTPVQFLRLVYTTGTRRWDFNKEVHVNFDKPRYKNFLKKGLKCECCGKKAVSVHLEVQERQPNIGSFEPYLENGVRLSSTNIRHGSFPAGTLLCVDCNHKNDK